MWCDYYTCACFQQLNRGDVIYCKARSKQTEDE